MSIGLRHADIKLLYKLRSLLGYGTVKTVKYSKTNPLRKKAEANGEEIPMAAVYIIRSKKQIESDIIE